MKHVLKVAAIAAISAAFVSGAVQSIFSARAVQNEWIPPTSGIYTGPQFSQLIGDAFRAVASGNKGSTAPAPIGGSVVDGVPWIDDTTSLWLKKRYVNGGWATEGAYDSTTSGWVGIIGGGLPVTIASGATVDLSVPQSSVTISGTASVSSFGSAAAPGVIKFVRFDDALQLVHSSTLQVPGGYSVTTAAGDRAILRHLGSGTWEIVQYTRANGVPLDVAAVGRQEFGFYESAPPLYVLGYAQAIARADYPVYLARVTRTQNGTRASGNATISSVGNTSAFGPGMPVEGTGINAGCTIASVGASSITLNSSSCVTSSGTSPVTVFLTGYGTGGGTSTVGVPDCRGYTLAGRDHNLSGGLANRLTSSWFANSSIMAIAGGLQTHTLDASQLPANIPYDDPGHTHPASTRLGSNTAFGSLPLAGAVDNNTALIDVEDSVTNITINPGGGGAHPNVQPTLIAECVVRVTP
jgi:hypothetical protein